MIEDRPSAMRHRLGETLFVAILFGLAILDAATLPLRAAELASKRARAWWSDL